MNPLMAVEVTDGIALHFPRMVREGSAPKEGAASELEEQVQEWTSGSAAQMETAQTDTLEAGISLEEGSEQRKVFMHISLTSLTNPVALTALLTVL